MIDKEEVRHFIEIIEILIESYVLCACLGDHKREVEIRDELDSHIMEIWAKL